MDDFPRNCFGNLRRRSSARPACGWLLAAWMLVGSFSVKASPVEKLVEQLKKKAEAGKGISIEEQEIAKQVEAIGPPAIPYLLALLQSPDDEVVELAAYTLSDMADCLTEEHLDALIASQRRRSGWLPSAIARIGGPKAVTFLIEELVRDRQAQTQLTGAVARLGTKAVPELLQIYEGNTEWDEGLEEAMNNVFKDMGKGPAMAAIFEARGEGATATMEKAMGEGAVAAITPLLKIADTVGTAPENRRRALEALGAIGRPAESVAPDLVKLQKDREPKVQAAATAAILAIGAAAAAPILVERLEKFAEPSERRWCIRDIAELQTRGRAAGPAIVKCLEDESWAVQAAAARALGLIGYEDSVDALIGQLSRTENWPLVINSAESLGRFKAERALPALAEVAKTNWYPPVRAKAEVAMKAIRGDPNAKLDDATLQDGLYFFDYDSPDEAPNPLTWADRDAVRFPLAPNQDARPKVTYKFRDEGMKTAQWPGIEVEEGFLVAINLLVPFKVYGDCGGMTFVDREGNPSLISREGFQVIYQTADGILAVTGPGEIPLGSDAIYKVHKGADGQWVTTPWRTLPGYTRDSLLLKDGSLLVTASGGIVLVTPNGEMKLVHREEVLKRK